MTNKEDFVAAFKDATGKEPQSFAGKTKEFMEALNAAPPSVRRLFRDAIEEANEAKKEDSSAGLGQLFGNLD